MNFLHSECGFTAHNSILSFYRFLEISVNRIGIKCTLIISARNDKNEVRCCVFTINCDIFASVTYTHLIDLSHGNVATTQIVPCVKL